MNERVESVGLTWLIRLRWLTLAAQCLAFATAWWTGGRPMHPAVPAGLLVALALSNAGLAAFRPKLAPRRTLGAVLIVDTVVLTALLHTTGGPMNPFTALYLVFITMAAVLLGTRWVFAILVESIAGYAVLFALTDAHAHHMHDLTGHLRGMWIAFGVSAALIAVFVTRLTRELAARDQELADERERAARSAQVAALTSLAAGAAHELGTPIGTMVIAAGELERALEGRDVPAEVLDDVRLIREEGRRCRAVLDGLSEAGGAARGEGLASVTLAELVERALDHLGPERARVHLEGDRDAQAELPPTALAVALRNLLRNALDATGSDEPVRVSWSADDRTARFEVRDEGEGMSAEIAEQATDPFFTTKREGMGLGLFLVRALAEQLGGELALETAAGRGTTVRLLLPRAARRPA